MNDNYAFKDNLKSLRKNQKLSQKKLAEMAEISPRILQMYESGEVSPSVDTMIKIANALSVSIGDLMWGNRPGTEDHKKHVDEILKGIGITTQKTVEESLSRLDDFNDKLKKIIESNGLSENEILNGLEGAGDLIKNIESKNVDVASLLNSIEMIIKFAGVKYDENSEMYLLLKMLNDNAFPVLLDTLLEKNRINK